MRRERERESAIPRRDTKPKLRYRTVDADYWPMIPISRWHLRAVVIAVIIAAYCLYSNRDALDLVSSFLSLFCSLNVFAYLGASYTNEFKFLESGTICRIHFG